MTTSTAPAGADTLVTRLRAAIPPRTGTFTPDLLAGLPEPARRWLTRAIAPGTALSAGADLQMHGRLRLGHWRSFTAREVIVPGCGFVWTAHTHVAGLPVRGHDSYVDGAGEMDWRLGGVLPVQAGAGFDVSLSAFDRLVAESVFVPTALIDAEWQLGDGRNAAVLVQQRDEQPHWTRVTIWVEPDGRLSNVSLWRWGDPTGSGSFGLHRFEVSFDAEFEADGIRLPSGVRAAWVGNGGVREEFFRATIDAAVPWVGEA